MDGDSYKQGKNINNQLDVSTVFQPFWVRLCNSANISPNRFVLDYNKYFVPISGLIFWLIYFSL